MISAGITALIVVATAAFGAVYPWGYFPLFAAAGAIGFFGIFQQRGVPLELRPLTLALAVLILAVTAQLVPLPRSILAILSPHAVDLLSHYSVAFAGGSAHPLSINADATARAWLGLCAFGVYLIGLPGLITRGFRRRVPRNIIIFASVMALVGIYGREHNNGLVYGFWQPQDGTNANGFGPFVNRNHFAGWMLMATCLALGVLCGRIESAFGNMRTDIRSRVIWLASPAASRLGLVATGVLVMAVALIWTMSRSGIVSFACAVGCFAVLMLRRRSVARSRRLLVVAFFSTLLIVSVNWRGIDRVFAWFGDTADLNSRVLAWRDGWHVVTDFPLVGTGVNTYSDAMLFYQRSVLDFWMVRAHNDYLQLLAEGGLLVFVPALAAMLSLCVIARRRIRRAAEDATEYWLRVGAAVGMTAVAIQETVEFSLQMPANALLFMTLAALIITPLDESRLATSKASTALPQH